MREGVALGMEAYKVAQETEPSRFPLTWDLLLPEDQEFYIKIGKVVYDMGYDAGWSEGYVVGHEAGSE